MGQEILSLVEEITGLKTEFLNELSTTAAPALEFKALIENKKAEFEYTVHFILNEVWSQIVAE